MINLFKLVASFLFILTTICASYSADKIVTVLKFINATAAEIKKNNAAIDKMQETVNSQCFANLILARTMLRTNNMSSIEVLNKIRSTPKEIEIQMYRDNSSTIGYTFKSKNRIWANRKYHDKFDACSVAANLSHEVFGHKNGFTHSVKASKARASTVPYVIGKSVEICCVE